jgi:hypothetical protein
MMAERIGGDVFNREFAKTDTVFLAACEKAGVKPTPRQASKFRRKMGKAYNVGKN